MNVKNSNSFEGLMPALFVVLWSTGFIVARLSAGHVEPVSFLAFRFPLAALLLFGVALAMGTAWPSWRDARHAMMAGVLLHALYLAPIYWAVAHGMPAGVSALIVGLQPLITAFLAAPLLGEHISLRHWLALAVGMLGVGMVLAPKLNLHILTGISPVTAGLCLFGTCAVALGTIYQKRHVSNLPLITSVAWQYVGASAVVVGLAALTEHFAFDHSPQAWAALGWSVIVLSVGAIFLLMMLIKRGAVSRVSSMIFLVPAVTAVMAYALFGERLVLVQIAGMVVCGAAVLLVTRAKPASH